MKPAMISTITVLVLSLVNLAQGQMQIQDSAGKADFFVSQVQSFPVGSFPVGIVSDGTSIWVTNESSNSVTKLKASNGDRVGTFEVGGSPFGVTFDGKNVWVANGGSNTVTKLRASDGARLGTFRVGVKPSGMTFDGTNIWVANFGSNTVSRVAAKQRSDPRHLQRGIRTRRHGFRRRQPVGGQLWLSYGDQVARE
jgi:YVTN family beta-propeller protein